jgi:hypothetical protein
VLRTGMAYDTITSEWCCIALEMRLILSRAEGLR